MPPALDAVDGAVAAYPVPADEATRLILLRQLGLLDVAPDPEFDEIAMLAAGALCVPISLVTFVDATRQLFKARVGFSVPGTSRCVSFCCHAIAERELFVIEDATLDPRFRDNPLVTDEPHIRFYAGMPIFSSNGSTRGTALGTVCVADHMPRTIDAFQRDMLRSLAERAAAHIESLERRYASVARDRSCVEADEPRRWVS